MKLLLSAFAAVLAVLLALGIYSTAAEPSWGLPGRWCPENAVRITCYRDWLGALSGWAAVAAAVIAAKIAYDTLVSARAEADKQHQRHLDMIALQARPREDALRRAYTGVAEPLEKAMLRLSNATYRHLNGFGGLGGLGGMRGVEPEEELKEVFDTIDGILSSQAFNQASAHVTGDIEASARTIRAITAGRVPPAGLLDFVLHPMLSSSPFSPEDRRRISRVKREVDDISEIIRSEMRGSGVPRSKASALDETAEEETVATNDPK